MRRALVLVLIGALACEKPPPPLSPTERAAKDRSECLVIAIDSSGFDPAMAEAPPRTISSTQQRGGDVVGSGAVVKGGAKGALVGVAAGAVAGDAGKGAAAGAVAGALIGGARRRRETKEMVTTTHPNPDYQAYMAAKNQYKSALDNCLDARAKAAAQEVK